MILISLMMLTKTVHVKSENKCLGTCKFYLYQYLHICLSERWDLFVIIYPKSEKDDFVTENEIFNVKTVKLIFFLSLWKHIFINLTWFKILSFSSTLSKACFSSTTFSNFCIKRKANCWGSVSAMFRSLGALSVRCIKWREQFISP